MISGANPDNRCRHQEAYTKAGGNRRRKSEQQIFFRLHLVEFRHGLLHKSEAKKPSPGRSDNRLSGSRTQSLKAPEQWVRQHFDEAAEIDMHWMQGVDLDVMKIAIRHSIYDPRISKNTVANSDSAACWPAAWCSPECALWRCRSI